jgi:predicted acyltransferase
MAFGGNSSESEFWRKTLRRTVIIFALGMLLHWFPFFRLTDHGWVYKPFSEVRILGVLERIALCYFIAAVAVRYMGVKGLLALSAALLLGYWAILLAGAPDAVTALSKEGNIGNAIDLAVIGRPHMYRGDEGFEPEGLLDTLPAAVNVILGYLAGLYIRREGANARTVTRFLAVGAALIVAALLWNSVFPIGKKLWTSSFVLLTIGIGLVVLAGLIAWIDIAKRNFGVRFFEVFGRNPILLYCVAIFLEMIMGYIRFGDPHGLWSWFGSRVMQALAPGPLGSLLTAILYMLLCWLVALWLYRRKVLIRI